MSIRGATNSFNTPDCTTRFFHVAESPELQGKFSNINLAPRSGNTVKHKVFSIFGVQKGCNQGAQGVQSGANRVQADMQS